MISIPQHAVYCCVYIKCDYDILREVLKSKKEPLEALYHSPLTETTFADGTGRCAHYVVLNLCVIP